VGSLFEAVAGVATRQHGRISHAQLLAAGVDRDRITRWLADGRLLRVHRKVYAVGHTAPAALADLMAAVLACGEGVASHRSTLHARGILRERPPRPEVSVASRSGRRQRGIVVHRVASLPPLDTTTFHGIPMTTVERALLDVAPTFDPSALCRACHEAWVRYRVSPAHIEACIARNPTKKGAAKLRRACGSDATLSEFEQGFLRLLERHDLPRPRTNIDRHGDKVDCYWAHLDLTIELLSYRFHESRWAFETDTARRRRSHHLAYTWGDVFERADQTAAELRPILLRRPLSPPAPPPPRASSAHTPGHRGRAPGW
jgi:hypothetical protein